MKRVIILKNMMVKALAVPSGEELSNWMRQWSAEELQLFKKRTQAEFESQVQRLRANGLWEEASDQERIFLQASATEIGEQERVNASWLAEPIACLLWALGNVSELPRYDEQVSHDLIKELPKGSDFRLIISQAHLRALPDLKKQRDGAELWHWRCRTKRLIESGEIDQVLANGTSMDKIIAEATTKAAEQGDIDAVIDGDFPAFGKAFRDLTAAEVATVTSIAQERHRAFNWLCGCAPQNRWADTPTDT